MKFEVIVELLIYYDQSTILDNIISVLQNPITGKAGLSLRFRIGSIWQKIVSQNGLIAGKNNEIEVEIGSTEPSGARSI